MVSPHISLIQATANSNSLNAAIALSEAGLLNELITTLAHNPQGHLSKYLKLLPDSIDQRLSKELGRRTWTLTHKGSICTHNSRELLRLALLWTNSYRFLKLDRRYLIDWVYTSLDRHVAQHHLNNIHAVYAYEDGAATTFQAAKQRGLLCLYDLPICFYRSSRAIQTQEAELFPELAPALQAVREPDWKLERKEQEICLADHIFVASSMTQRSLLEAGINPDKISVIPYGAPIEYFQPQPKPDSNFRVLFAGRLSPRKGIHYLLQAWQEMHLPNSELLLVGSNLLPPEWFKRYSKSCRHISSVPHASLNQYYSSANVLVFPSLVEGFGLVLTEAMACGIPIITTPNTAGPDIITDGVEGFIIPIRDVDALKEKLEWCYRHPQELAEMGYAARRKAEQLTWDLYRHRLTKKVKQLLEQHISHQH